MTSISQKGQGTADRYGEKFSPFKRRPFVGVKREMVLPSIRNRSYLPPPKKNDYKEKLYPHFAVIV